jgi:hypothetical protein
MAILGHAGLGLDDAVVRPQAKVPAADVDGIVVVERGDFAIGIAVGPVDPVVQAPQQAVDAVLLVAFDETFKK